MLDRKEKRILEKLVYAVEKDPSMPTFPVTRTIPISVPEFSNVFVKDESTNPTGTHKDRMAWEIVMTYKAVLESKRKGLHDEPLPNMSLISAGSAALAIQIQLRSYGLPNLKILVDDSTRIELTDYLEEVGCEVFRTDLANKPLAIEEILALTDNTDGFDVTSNEGFDPGLRFYDWLSYEILNENPDFVFVPYGTGQLYENILRTARRIQMGEKMDPLFVGDPEKVKRCGFIGATTNSPESKATKLYAPFRPFTSVGNGWIRIYSLRGICGIKSRIQEVDEAHLETGHRILNERGIPAEYSAGAGMGLLYQINDEIPKDSKILVVSTGKTKMP